MAATRELLSALFHDGANHIHSFFIMILVFYWMAIHNLVLRLIIIIHSIRRDFIFAMLSKAAIRFHHSFGI